uniref:acid phosphatase n=1 Tax=Ampulex compressa TaxID=860918 RepID=A0A1W6EVT0_AMPCP|nr:testicular acid phosphatase-like protein [Ampulex compressa]
MASPTGFKHFAKFFLFIVWSIVYVLADDLKLEQVNVVFRHGDRTPNNAKDETYATDPYRQDQFYPYGPAALTNQGKRRSYELGQVLRQRYDQFLGEIYYPHEVYGRSTDSDRTKMSLALVLAALYPPVEDQRWNSTLNWQPAVYTYMPFLKDGLLMPFICPKYLNEYRRVEASEEILTKFSEYDELKENVSFLTGKNITNFLDLFILYHTFLTQSKMGLTLPSWVSTYFPGGQLKDAAVFQYKLFNYNTMLKRRNGGILLHRMIMDMRTSMATQTLAKKKINLYSGHDVTVFSLLNTLGIDSDDVPEFGSAAILELYSKDDNYFVKVVRYLGIPATIEELTIPGCETLCPFEQFVVLTTPVIPIGIELACDIVEDPPTGY